MDQAINGRPTISGMSVNPDTAMNFSAFFNGVMQISQTIASLPLIYYKRINEFEKRRYTEHPLYALLHDKANPYMPAYYWRECSTNHQILAGNSYSYIERDRGYRPVALWPLNPLRVDPVWENNRLFYVFNRVDGVKVPYDFDEILHIPGFGYDGRKGYSVLELARESIALGLNLEEFHSRFIAKGAHIQGVLQAKSALGPKARENLRKSFDESYAGLSKTAKTIVLEEGIEYNKIGMSLVDAEFLSSRVFSIQEVARWLNMPPHKLKEQTHATYSNVESENLSFYQDTIRPYLSRQEAFINFKLVGGGDSFAEYLFEAILRADIKSRSEAYNTMRNAGVINANTWADKENLPRPEDGSGATYLRPANMIPANSPVPTQIDTGGKPDAISE